MDDVLKDNRDQVTIIQGGCEGTDALAARYAAFRGHECETFRAAWRLEGSAAGPKRNQRMVDYIKDKDKKIAVFFWNENSKGTSDCLKRAKEAGISYIVHKVE